MTITPGSRPNPYEDDVVPGGIAVCECEERDLCRGCGEPVCPNHGDPVTECAEGGWHHCDDCAFYCTPCAEQAWEDEQHERADQIRKGEWDD